MSYASRHPQNPWPTEEEAGGEDPKSWLILSLEDYKDSNGAWNTFTNEYGEREELVHQQNYGTFAKAVQAIIQEADSGALKEKVICKRKAALYQSGPRMRAQGTAGRAGVSSPCPFSAELVVWVVPLGIAQSAPHAVESLEDWATGAEPETLAYLK